jgi:hypothetical protein
MAVGIPISTMLSSDITPPHTYFWVSLPWLKHKCGVFHRAGTIFRQNGRKSAALINGQEA